MNKYKINKKIIRYFFKDSSDQLFDSAWRKYRFYLQGSIDDPCSDQDVIIWIDALIHEKVNNPKSKFYLTG